MTTPSHWLIYSLVLRQLKSHTESYDSCFRIARDCGITDHDEHKEALHFIHTKMGIICYFPQDELKELVIIDTQVIFDKITELIVETFTFEQVGKHVMDDFKKGIFSFSDFERISNRNNPDPLLSLLTPSLFVKLLEYLRIAAPFHQEGVLKYFFPCALSHVDELDTQLQDSTIPPLVVSFKCNYCPMGLAGALIKYLMTNEMDSDFHWEIQTDKIFRNQVSFFIIPTCDTIVLKVLPTHIEIKCLPEVLDEDRDTAENTCMTVHKAVKAGIERITADINYIHNSEPCFTFYCRAKKCVGSKDHPARLVIAKDAPRKLRLVCPKNHCTSLLPKGYQYWRLPDIESAYSVSNSLPLPDTETVKEPDVQCSSSHHALLLTQLSKHAAKWRNIGTHLGFCQEKLDNIQHAPLLLGGAPESWLGAMLSMWLEWVPGDQRGSTQYATLANLKSAVVKSGLGKTAQELTLQVKEH